MDKDVITQKHAIASVKKRIFSLSILLTRCILFKLKAMANILALSSQLINLMAYYFVRRLKVSRCRVYMEHVVLKSQFYVHPS